MVGDFVATRKFLIGIGCGATWRGVPYRCLGRLCSFRLASAVEQKWSALIGEILDRIWNDLDDSVTVGNGRVDGRELRCAPGNANGHVVEPRERKEGRKLERLFTDELRDELKMASSSISDRVL